MVRDNSPWGSGHKMYKDLMAERLLEAMHDQNAGSFFGQRISIGIKRCNAVRGV